MTISNEEIKEVYIGIPDNHRHIRTTIVLSDGSDFTFQEATIAGIVMAYISIKTHPQRTAIRLKGMRVSDKKPDYAEWQLLEENT
jgi:hypothetical protein